MLLGVSDVAAFGVTMRGDAEGVADGSGDGDTEGDDVGCAEGEGVAEGEGEGACTDNGNAVARNSSSCIVDAGGVCDSMRGRVALRKRGDTAGIGRCSANSGTVCGERDEGVRAGIAISLFQRGGERKVLGDVDVGGACKDERWRSDGSVGRICRLRDSRTAAR